MIDRSHALPIARQAKALNISRGSVYYLPRSASAAGLAIMRRIDELHLDSPFAGSRMLRRSPERRRRRNRPPSCRYADESAWESKRFIAKPNTSKRAPGHKIYPYLLRKTKVARSDHVWAMDITYIPMARGFVYLAAVRRLVQQARAFSSRGRSRWRPTSASKRWRRALAKYGRPEIFNTDQGSQFTGAAFTDVLLKAGVAISMDGKGSLARQCLCRKALAIRHVRGGLSQGLQDGDGGPRLDRQLSSLLQFPQTPFEP